MAVLEHPAHAHEFRHEALLYAGLDGFLAHSVPFVRDGIRQGEPVMVAVSQEKIDGLTEALGDDADEVHFVDMVALGRNPACIIPAWHQFLAERGGPGTAVRGIGEPVWSTRRAEELVESQLHEALLNLAFADAEDFRLLCPYDVTALSPEVVHEARCSHPYVIEEGADQPSRAYRGAESIATPFEGPLPTPSVRPDVLSFDLRSLPDVRALISRHGDEAGLSPDRRNDLTLAMHELAANSVRHGGGNGVLRVWRDAAALVCEVRDRGHVTDPLVGRKRPEDDVIGGRGLWIVNQLCDLVQLRSGPEGTVVRVHMGSVAD
jgi:anti-sigma regulatory factor (Ser/Thr protein kinase)